MMMMMMMMMTAIIITAQTSHRHECWNCLSKTTRDLAPGSPNWTPRPKLQQEKAVSTSCMKSTFVTLPSPSPSVSTHALCCNTTLRISTITGWSCHKYYFCRDKKWYLWQFPPMINFIDAHLSEYQNDSPEITREMLQTKLKLFCIKYTHNRSKNREYRK